MSKRTKSSVEASTSGNKASDQPPAKKSARQVQKLIQEHAKVKKITYPSTEEYWQDDYVQLPINHGKNIFLNCPRAMFKRAGATVIFE